MSKKLTLREKLDQIDGWLLEGDGLYQILTALRGPDKESTDCVEIKTRVTAPIRTKAFPRWAEVETTFASWERYYNKHHVEVAKPGVEPMIAYNRLDFQPNGDLLVAGGHFVTHAEYAIGMLHSAVGEKDVTE